MPRTIVSTERYRSEPLSPGVFLEQFHPGGKHGPNDEVLSSYPGGQVWSEMVTLGDNSDSFQLAIPDIRLPANQIWPLHWHDCWVGIVIVEGTCLIGDWWMKSGDVLITAASVEYGPLLIGPQGCRMFEVFAKLHLQAGGYAPEYRDHPTLQGASMPFNFSARIGVNKRNEGRQCLAIGGDASFTKGSLIPGSQWSLGQSGDPERGMMKVTRFSPGESLAPHSYDDWHAILVVDGSLQVAGRSVLNDQYLVIRARNRLDEMRAGEKGALLLELSRTARGMHRNA
jgi:hypothetical protein